ncbi:MAG: hypothetical protein HQ568_10690, partial [Calditrichaeota bacterium]|nr:hypothetical protein [Calditrichota bacterium]
MSAAISACGGLTDRNVCPTQFIRVNVEIEATQKIQLSGVIIIALMLIVSPLLFTVQAALDVQPESKGPKGPERVAISQINQMNRVHKRSNIWMNITNWGYFGNSGENARNPRPMTDPCLGVWASQCEYPGGSGTQYMYMGALWIGALIRKEGF